MQEQMSTHNITVTWRGKKLIVEMNSGASLKDLGHKLQKLTDVKADTMRLIVPQASDRISKLLSPFSDEHSSLYLQETSFLRMMGVPKDEVDEVLQNAKANLRIAGFEEGERRMRQRMLDRSHGSLKLPQGQYIFCDFRTLHIPGLELSPPATEALKRMHMLAADPGIVAIMNKHRWRVGIMTEMAPVGYVGVSPKCILGFNKNHGEEISLRLRTDDLKGFRKYESIKKTLLHELAHMVFSEHDASFFALDKQLNQEAAALDWTRSKGHTLSGVRHSENYGEFSIDDRGSSSQKLGGKTPDQFANARATSVAAAYRRLANLSSGDKDNGPDDFGLHQEPEFMDVEEIGKLNIVNSDNFLWKDDSEPDPDDCLNSRNKFEPDPDDIEDVEAMESEPYLESTGGLNISEPDPDDSHITEFLPPVTMREIARNKAPEDPNNSEVSNKTVDEPDPDDSLVEEKMGCGNVARPSQGGAVSIENVGNEIQLSRDDREPDPDDSVENGGTQTNEPHPDDQELQRIQVSIENIENEIPLRRDDGEPDPDDSVENRGTQTNEPDPDDQELQRIEDPVTIIFNRLQKAIEMLQSEVNPTEISGVLQTLFKIIRNVIEHPYETKFKRIRKDNPIIKRNVANYKAAMDILSLIGFNEDVVLDDIGRAETYLVLKRNDPGLLWLAKSSLETCIAY